MLQQSLPALSGFSPLKFTASTCAMLADQIGSRCLSAGPTTATPPPDAARGATADLCDMFITDSVDVITEREVQIMEPIFRYTRLEESPILFLGNLYDPTATCIHALVGMPCWPQGLRRQHPIQRAGNYSQML